MPSDTNRNAVVLMNLGTPENPDPKSVKRFLTEFLSDPRVVEARRWLWLPLLKFVVAPLRCRRVAKLYRSIWSEKGSPIRCITEQQVSALQKQIIASGDKSPPKVVYAMTYGNPKLMQVVEKLRSEGYEKILVLPLYPQYSGSTTGAIYDQIADIYRSCRDVPNIRVVKHYYENIAYIEALAQSVEHYWRKRGRNERLLLSFHGVPQSYIDAGDPYYLQCKETAELLAARLKLEENTWAFSFQSRFGPKEWVKPYTESKLQEWLAAGVKSVDVISPAFAADCLETLEELDCEIRDFFMENGGQKYGYIPCLNANEAHILLFQQLVENEL